MVFIKNTLISAAAYLLTSTNHVDARESVKENLTKEQSFAFNNARRNGNRANTYKKAQKSQRDKNPDHVSKHKVPLVEEDTSLFYDYCTLAGDRLEDGPDNFNNYLGVSGALYTDMTFEGREQLYWEGHSTLQ